ncbi:patj homolog isoform X2 [Tachypleus tridentatus]|uniref:patj homolog isoform X2 n=1 Tax=Tachypleus tridentatus TaxID=6853 RepID=UPI003FD550C7
MSASRTLTLEGLYKAISSLEMLDHVVTKSEKKHEKSNVEDDIHHIKSVLENPGIVSHVKILESLRRLKDEILQNPQILPMDFHIVPNTGELQLSKVDFNSVTSTWNYFDLHSPGSVLYSISHSGIPLFEEHSTGSKMHASPDASSFSVYNNRAPVSGTESVIMRTNHQDIFTVQLYKPEPNAFLGFSVVGLRSQRRGEIGLFVQSVLDTGLAGRDGKLQDGDEILAINGLPLDGNISHHQAVRVLQKARGLIELVVARSGKPVLNLPITETHQRSIPTEIKNSIDFNMVLNTEWAQVEAIDLMSDGSGLGFGIIGGRSTGVVVKTLIPGGVAERDGRLRSGDHILQIGEVNLRGMGSEQVAAVLRQCGSEVHLIVARPVEPSSPDYHNIQNNAPIVPTRILGDPNEIDRHLTMLHQSENGFADNLVFNDDDTGSPDGYLDRTSMEFQQEPLEIQTKEIEGAANITIQNEEAAELPEMETFEVDLTKDQQGLGITIAGYVCEEEDISGIFVKSIAKASAADLCGRIKVNDQIIEVDGRSLRGYTNHQAVDVLRSTGKMVKLRLARYLRGVKYEQLQQAIASGEPNVPFRSTTQVLVHEPKIQQINNSRNADVFKGDQHLNNTNLIANNHYSGTLLLEIEATIKAEWEKIMGPKYEIVVVQFSKLPGVGLGISLTGTVDVEGGKEVRPHHYLRSILNDGPVGQNGKLRTGDELLEVNGKKLYGLNYVGVVSTLKELPSDVRLVCARNLHQCLEAFIPPSAKICGSPVTYPPFSRIDYEVTSTDDSESKGSASEPSGGSLSSLTPLSERLVKAKSEGFLAVGVPASSLNPPCAKLRSRSLEPLTALAMWSDEPHVVELPKGDRGLGFSILDYQDPMNPNETIIVIRSLVPGGVAQQDGRLLPGDRLLFVNDVPLENACLETAVQALKGASKGVVRIGVAKPLPLPESDQMTVDDLSCSTSRGSSPNLPPTTLPSRFGVSSQLNEAQYTSLKD